MVYDIVTISVIALLWFIVGTVTKYFTEMSGCNDGCVIENIAGSAIVSIMGWVPMTIPTLFVNYVLFGYNTIV